MKIVATGTGEHLRTINDFAHCPKKEAYKRFGLPEDVRDWTVENAQRDLLTTGLSKDRIHPLCYRPFNLRYTYYTGNARGFIGWPVDRIMRHLLAGRNVALVATRQTKDEWGVLATRHIVGHKACGAYDVNTVFPLYLFTDPREDSLQPVEGAQGQEQRQAPNLDRRFVQYLEQVSELQFVPAAGTDLLHTVGPKDVFNYAYAIFHSAEYRRRYAEFLKSDFPRLPLTANRELLRVLARLGGDLVDLHVMESPGLNRPLADYQGPRNPVVEKVSYSSQTVWLDVDQSCGFRGVPEAVWELCIGGYQVCEKWLKDRKGRTLSKEDIAHYQKIVIALSESIRLMKEIDEVIVKHGGWPGAFQANSGAESTGRLKVAEERPEYDEQGTGPRSGA